MPGISAASAENIVATEPYAKLTEAQMKSKIDQAGLLRKEQQRLSQIEGMTYNEQEALDAVLEGSTEALLASQQRAQREVSRFRSRGGVTGSSLASQVSI
jgi:predicted lipase